MPRPTKYADAAEKQRAYRTRQAERLRAISEGRTPPPPAIGNMPATQRWNALQEQARSALDTLRDEMQAYYDARTEQWQESGSLDAAQRANAIWKRMLREYEPPPLDQAIDEALMEYMIRRKASFPDSDV